LLRQAGGQLVTLTGPGGIGKTRLALAVAEEVARDFPDGLAFVPLAPLADPALVLPALARALGLPEAAGRPPLALVRAALGARRALLVLDNCEHLLAAAPDLADVLAGCPGVAILATSRAPLRLRGEREYPVGPLALPDLRRPPLAAEVAAAPAAQLFVERARAVAPAFALTQEHAAAVAAICRRLDGLPLALELAAARIRLLAPTELLARLDPALPLLGGGARDLPARQRTMRDAIAWSHDLLTVEEQTFFRRLAVFAGGWDLAAAEAVAGDDAAHGLERLAALVEHSLVVAETVPGGETRYRLLEPVREYAWERLTAAGVAGAARQRHAEHYLALAERAGPELEAGQVVWLDRLQREHANLRAAMGQALEGARADLAVRLGWALWLFWYLRGHHDEGRRWMEAALAGGALPPPAQARAGIVAGNMALMQGDHAAGAAFLERALATFRALGDRRGILLSVSRLGSLCWFRGDYAGARARAEEGLALARAAGEGQFVARARWVLGLVALVEGDYATAEVIFADTADQVEAGGDLLILSGVHTCRAFVALAQGRADDAEARSRAGLALCGQLGMRWPAVSHLEVLAAVAVARDRLARAARLAGAAAAQREVVGLGGWPPTIQRLFDEPQRLLRARLDAATYATAWAAGHTLMLEEAVEYALATDDA
ncbi:MAG TPA: AAA family ATPase, partial [Vicinamibacteria bacterium]